MAAFITPPMSFMVGEPISAIAAFTPGYNLLLARRLGEITLDQRDFRSFLVGHLFPSALQKLLHGLLALFDQRRQHLLRFFVVEWRHLFDFAVL